MQLATELSVVIFGLLAAFSWGSGDFSGGAAARRMSVAGVLALSHPVGLVLLLILARLNGETGIAPNDWFWGMTAGVCGAVGLGMLYQALAVGKAGVVAPVTSIIATALPVVFGISSAGLPGTLPLIGFALALVSLLLVTGAATGKVRPEGLHYAVVSGLGFGVFFILLSRIESEAVFLPLAVARLASSVVMIVFALATRSFRFPSSRLTLLAVVLAGTMDVVGNTFFSLAERSGRLDVAGVLSSLYPAVTVMWSYLIYREALTRVQFIGIVLGLAAVALIAL